MPAPANLVHQQSTTTGTGNLTLSAVNGKQSFNSAFGNGVTTNVFDYFISNQGAAEWERGTGHMSASSTIVRDTVIESSNSNAAVSFSAGTKDVVNDIPAAKQVGTDLTQTLTNKIITGSYSAKIWTGETPPANVNRLDRVLVGAATVNSGDSPTTTKDWLETLIANTTTLAQTASISPEGMIGNLGGSRAADGAGGMGTMGIAGFVQNNLASNYAYAGYFEAWTNSSANAGGTHGIEVDIVNKAGATAVVAPYSFIPSDLSSALWIASGGSRSGVSSASVAMGILDNGATFNKGIVFKSTALNTSVGTGGNGVAFEVARGQSLRWLNSGGSSDAEIYGNASGLNVAAAMLLTGSATSGCSGIRVSATQTARNGTDTDDSAFNLNFALTASSASDEIVTRVLKFSATNNLTGGGHINFMRMMEMAPVINTGAAVDNLDYLYMTQATGTAPANVTNVYGLHIPSGWQGSALWGVKDESTTNWAMLGSIATGAPVTKTGTSGSQGQYDGSLIINASGTFTLTLQAASSYAGRWLYIKSIAAQAVNSASSNVKPIGTNTAGTAILTATAGKWALLQSDGTNWIVMASN